MNRRRASFPYYYSGEKGKEKKEKNRNFIALVIRSMVGGKLGKGGEESEKKKWLLLPDNPPTLLILREKGKGGGKGSLSS